MKQISKMPTCLVILRDHSRTVAFKKQEDLVQRVTEQFSDVITEHQCFFLQIEKAEWNGRFVDLQNEDEVPDKSVVKVILVENEVR